MSKYVKSNILCFTIGAIIFSFISVYATESILGTNINYDNSKSGLASTDMQNAIDELYDMATYGDAGSGNILDGKTALINGNKVTGTMPDNKTWTSSPTTSTNVTIPAGYHNGLGYVDTSGVYNAEKTAYNPTSATLSNAGALSVKNAAGTQIYTNTFTNNYDSGYSSGRTQGRSDVTSSPGSYSLYTKSQYDTNYISGQNSVTISSVSCGPWSSNKCTATATASNGKTGTATIDATSIYYAGVSAGKTSTKPVLIGTYTGDQTSIDVSAYSPTSVDQFIIDVTSVKTASATNYVNGNFTGNVSVGLKGQSITKTLSNNILKISGAYATATSSISSYSGTKKGNLVYNLYFIG